MVNFRFPPRPADARGLARVGVAGDNASLRPARRSATIAARTAACGLLTGR
jgi:hypothetical protein